MKHNKKDKAMELQPAKQRIKWIDCAKAVAIIAVLVDHNSGLLYTNNNIKVISFFSVSLFVLLAGITAFDTTKVVRGGGRHKYWQGIGKLLLSYVIATFILQVWYNRFFDLQTYISHLLNFSIQSSYYFLLFFIQLKLISPFLVMWCRFCNKQKASWFWHMVSVLFLCWFSSILIRYTFMLQVHGGGKNLLGGTYLLLYYVGILMANFRIFERFKAKRFIILPVSLVLWIIWWQLSYLGKLPFDVMLSAYWGGGFNPPSVNFMVFALLTIFACYSGFSLLEHSISKIGKLIIEWFSFIGRYTLYIFMYHLMVRDVILTYLPFVQNNIWLMRLGIFIPMLVAPALAVWLVKKAQAEFMQQVL